MVWRECLLFRRVSCETWVLELTTRLSKCNIQICFVNVLPPVLALNDFMNMKFSCLASGYWPEWQAISKLSKTLREWQPPSLLSDSVWEEPSIAINKVPCWQPCPQHPSPKVCVPILRVHLETPVQLAQGTQQGAPESGLHLATLSHTLTLVLEQWDKRSEGCPLGTRKVSHLIYADDLLLINSSPHRASLNQDWKFMKIKPPTLPHTQKTPKLGWYKCKRDRNENFGDDLQARGQHHPRYKTWTRRSHGTISPDLGTFIASVSSKVCGSSNPMGQWDLAPVCSRLQIMIGVELAMMKTLIRCPKLRPERAGIRYSRAGNS